MSDEKQRKYSDDEVVKKIEDSYIENQRIDVLSENNRKMTTEITNARLKMQKREMDRISGIQEKLKDEDILERVFSRDDMLKSVDDRKKAVVFLNKEISLDFVIAPGSLVCMPSMTNNGKSTILAHIADALIATEETVLVLSNEETEEDVRARVSCLRKGISFGDYKTNRCSEEQIEIVLKDAHFLAGTKRLAVISSKNEADAYRVTTVDGMISTLKSVNKKVSAVIIDYYNNVNISELGAVDPWHVNNRLASELNILKGSLSYPVIIMAQCLGIKSEKKIDNKGQLDYESNHPMYRWKGGQNILMYATDIIELTKDFDNSCSWLFAHKIRFSHGNLERMHQLPFDKKMQRFTNWTVEWDASTTASKITRESNSKAKDLLADIHKDRDN